MRKLIAGPLLRVRELSDLISTVQSVTGRQRLEQPEPGRFVWISPLRRPYHVSRRPISTDLPGPPPRSEQYPAYAPPLTVSENWPILNRPPPEPDLPPSSAHVVDPDEPPPF